MQTNQSQCPRLGPIDLATADVARVSVVIPAYNASKHLSETLQSVFNQTSLPSEIIVVDDGSNDGTVELARSFRGVTVIVLENSGPAAARNAGTYAATGDYIAYLDADDLWAPDKLAVQLAALKSYGQPAFSFTDYRLFDESGFFKHKGELRRVAAFRRAATKTREFRQTVIVNGGSKPVMYDTSYILPSSALVRRSDVVAIGAFDETLRFGEDYEFFLRLFALVPAVVVMQPLFYYRQHPEQGTKKTATQMRAGYFDVAKRTAANPDRYPRGDVLHLARTDFLRQYHMAILHARRGEIDEASTYLEGSLAARWTLRAMLALVGARICQSASGRSALLFIRKLWRSRPGRR